MTVVLNMKILEELQAQQVISHMKTIKESKFDGKNKMVKVHFRKETVCNVNIGMLSTNE